MGMTTYSPSVGGIPTDALDTDVALTANSDAKVPSQKAVKAYVAANAGGSGGVIGTASFDASGASIASKHVDGVIADVTYTDVGAYTVTFTASQPDAHYAVSVICVNKLLFWAPDGVTGFGVSAMSLDGEPADAAEVRIAVMRL